MRDYQRQKVYNWENEVISPLDSTLLSVEEAQDLVDFIWAQEGRNHPPKVKINNRKAGADGRRIELRFNKNMLKRWVILHELAHAFEDDIDVKGDGHGPKFVKRYIGLLDKYMKIPKVMCWFTLKTAKVDYEI